MKLTRFSGMLAVALTVSLTTLAYAAGMFPGLPIVGGASYCQGTATGTTAQVCAVTVPAGPTTLTGLETIPVDTLAPNGVSPQTVSLPSTLIGNGFGGTTANATTGTQTPAVKDGISTYIYSGAGAATFTTFTFPPNPMQNQKLCLVNAGTGIITLSSLLVGTTGQVFVGTTPTSLPVMTAVGTAGTVTLGTNCWLYNVSNTTWFRVL